MKNIINEVLKFLGIMTIVTFGWNLLELVLTGKMNPNKVDTIVGSILTISLYKNLKSSNGNNK